jgi:predicted nucleic acid-binding protein
LKPVLVNAGPLIALGKLNRLPLLAQLFGKVHVPQAVFDEAVVEGARRNTPDALIIRLFLQHYSFPILDLSELASRSYVPAWELGAGERQLLALAQSFPAALVLLDDELAREEARRLGIPVKGTIGILVQAFREGLLDTEEVELLLLEIAARSDIWISEKLCRRVLDQLRAEA